MSEMSNELLAAAYEVAPEALCMKWRQQALWRAIQTDATGSSGLTGSDIEEIKGYVGIVCSPNEVGQYGYDAAHRLETNIDLELIRDTTIDADDALTFNEMWVNQLRDVIQEEQERSVFSPKEFVTYLSGKNPHHSERMIADALGVTVGTIRGKRGRIDDKLSKAALTMKLDAQIEQLPSEKAVDFQYHPAVLATVDEADLPITSVERTPRRENKRMFIVEGVNDDESFEVTIPSSAGQG